MSSKISHRQRERKTRKAKLQLHKCGTQLRKGLVHVAKQEFKLQLRLKLMEQR